MSTLKVDSIVDEAGSGAPEMPNGLTVGNTAIPTTGPLSNRNLIINGAMQVAQRSTSETGVTSTAGFFTVDRYAVNNDLPTGVTTMSYSQDTDAPDGFGYSFKIEPDQGRSAALSGADRMFVNYNIEAQDLQQLDYGSASAKTLTLSFWIKSNLTGVVTVEVSNPDTPNSNSQLYHETVTINAANTWEYKTISILGNSNGGIDNDNGTGLGFTWTLAAGPVFTGGTFTTGAWHDTTSGDRASPSNIDIYSSASNYVNITGVQMEVGDTATPFEHRSYGDELARCQRYYRGQGKRTHCQQGAGGAWNNADVYFSPLMRAAPTISLSDDTGNITVDQSASSAGVGGVHGFHAYATPANAAGYFDYTADAEL